jgi:hypothetical protein
VLDQDSSSTFKTTMALEEIFVRHLFVDEWIIYGNYANYYKQCDPYILMDLFNEIFFN